MVRIITGAVGAGKTALMRDLFHQTPAADGILSEKLFDKTSFIGYRLVHLQGGEGMEFALLSRAYQGQFEEDGRLGPYVFSAEAFRFGIGILERAIADPAVRALFLDEAGPLELKGQGFAGVLPALLGSGKDLYITVRTSCLGEFLRRYKVPEYQLIQVPLNES